MAFPDSLKVFWRGFILAGSSMPESVPLAFLALLDQWRA